MSNMKTTISALAIVAAVTTLVAEQPPSEREKQVAEILHRIETTVIPEIKLTDDTPEQAVEDLSKASAAYSSDGIGIKITVNRKPTKLEIPPGLDEDIQRHIWKLHNECFSPCPSTNQIVTLHLLRIPLSEALKYVAAMSGFTLRTTASGVELGCPQLQARVSTLRPEVVGQLRNCDRVWVSCEGLQTNKVMASSQKGKRFFSDPGITPLPITTIPGRRLLIWIVERECLGEAEKALSPWLEKSPSSQDNSESEH